jgi:prepilin-type N-terminal cleavage/methylation domain-containing protein
LLRRSIAPFLRVSDSGRRLGTGSATERGDTLIELLLALTVIGIVVAGVMDGLIGAATGSTIYGSVAGVDTLAKSYLDSVVQSLQSSTSPYVGCPIPSPNAYTSAVGLPGGYSGTLGTLNGQSAWRLTYPPAFASYTVEVTQVAPWNGSSFTTMSPCSDYGMQEIVVTASSRDGTNAQLSGVARNPNYEICYANPPGYC